MPIADHVFRFSASLSGTIAYAPNRPAKPTLLTWFDRSGRPLGTVGDPYVYQQVRLAPDGRHIAIHGAALSLWVLDLATKVMSPLTSRRGVDPVWADNQSIVFNGPSGSRRAFFRRPLGGPADIQLAEAEIGHFLDDVSLDGRFLVSHFDRERSRLQVLPVAGNAKPIVVADSPQSDGAHFSPDSQWIAYQSDESGQFEVYVVSFPKPQYRKQVSVHGGTQARWRRDGKELFYLSADRTLMSVPVAAGPAASAFGAPVALFKVPDRVNLHAWGYDDYDVTADGSRFVMPAFSEAAPPPAPVPITVMLNWLSGRK